MTTAGEKILLTAMAGRADIIFLLCSQDELSEVVWISYAICHIPCGYGLFCLREQGIYIEKW